MSLLYLWRLPLLGFLGIALALAGCKAQEESQTFPLLNIKETHQPSEQPELIFEEEKVYPPPGEDECGVDRILKPEVMAKREPVDCGPHCKQVTFANFVEREWDVRGRYLVYSGTRGGGSRTHYVDLETNTEFGLQTFPKFGQGCTIVSTDGERIAYSCMRRDLSEHPHLYRSITTFDPQTFQEKDHHCILRDTAKDFCYPRHLRLGPQGIALAISLGPCREPDAFFYSFANDNLNNLSQTFGGAHSVRMFGNRIAWEETGCWSKYCTRQIVVYDVDTKEKKRIAPTDTLQLYPQISKDKVVWIDYRNEPLGTYEEGNSDIYLHNFTTGKTELVTDHPAQQIDPDVDGDWVVWTDMRNNTLKDGTPNPTPTGYYLNSDIYAKNMKTGQVFQLTNFPGLEIFPRVDSGRAFFIMLDSENASVFMIDLESLAKSKAKEASKPSSS